MGHIVNLISNRKYEPASHRLKQNKERVLRLWEERVRKEIPAAAEEPQAIIIDTIPVLIDQLIEALDFENPRKTVSEGSTAPQEHGSERARVTHFNLDSVIREYQILREVIFE